MGQSNSSEDGGSLEQLPTPTNACPVLVPGFTQQKLFSQNLSQDRRNPDYPSEYTHVKKYAKNMKW